MEEEEGDKGPGEEKLEMEGARENGNSSWAVDIDKRAKDMISLAAKEEELWKKHSIYKIPEGFGGASRRDAYEPQLVSFGPYHHNDMKVQSMAKEKERALLHFLGRSQKSVSLYMEALEPVAELLMGSYKELDAEWRDQGKFLRLMLVDGCFLIEVLRSTCIGNPQDYAATDPIFSHHGMLKTKPRMMRDMLMLENQIPLLVVKKLLAVEERSPIQDDEAINQLVLDFFSPMGHSSQKELGLHVLDVVRKSRLEDPSGSRNSPAWTWDVIWPTTQLQEAGIKFERSRSRRLNDIIFEKGVLRLPEITVDAATESMLLNLMAFEHLHADAGNEVTSYVAFMNMIINSERDVVQLSQSGIVINIVGSDDAVANLFKGIARDAWIDQRSQVGAVHRAVAVQCHNVWSAYRVNKDIVDLRHTYVKSPWTIISLIAAIILLSLTIIQTLYTILQYYQPN